ncbi:hypothetical protein ILUMI_04236, partial [Ignelater luminosus]
MSGFACQNCPAKIQESITTTRNFIRNLKVNKLVINYIVEEMPPICTVEKPAFVKLVEGLSGRNPCDRKTLRSKLESKTKCVCTTADIWSAQNKLFG